MNSTEQLLPPPLVHELRSRSFPRLFRMAGNPGNRGFGRYLRQRIRDIVNREKLLVEKAITVSYLGSYLVDHIIFAEKIACRILEQRELTEPEEKLLWEKNFGDVVVQLAFELPEGQGILDTVQRLDQYGRLPPSVYRLRARHWNLIQRMLAGPMYQDDRGHAEITLMRRIQFVLCSERSVRAKARYVGLVASILADKQCWNEHLPWEDAFLEAMTDLYPALIQHPLVLEYIVLKNH